MSSTKPETQKALEWCFLSLPPRWGKVRMGVTSLPTTTQTVGAVREPTAPSPLHPSPLMGEGLDGGEITHPGMPNALLR